MKIAIIGAGVAGLSAANALIDLGITSTIIEANFIGREKVTGEFFSPESLPVLKKWGVPLLLLNSGIFNTCETSFKFNFNIPAGSISHALAEKILADRAVNLGVQLLTNRAVTNIELPTDKHKYILTLSSGELINADILIIASGRAPGLGEAHNKKIKPKYIGVKAHFSKIYNIEDQLEFYITDGAYWGVTAIENGKTNITCLLRSTLVDDIDQIDKTLNNLFGQFPEFKNRVSKAEMLFSDWLVTPVFGFGKKRVPNWPEAYFIGDAAASIYPAAGNGLSMGIAAGIMAADHINKKFNFKKTQKKFYTLWSQRYSSRLVWAEILHNLFMHLLLVNFAFKLANKWPKLANIFYNKTREN